jgi:hypothetical protein
MGKYSACLTFLGTTFPQYLDISLYQSVPNTFLSYEKVLLFNMDEDGEASAEEELLAKKNDEVVVESTEEEQWQASPKYKRRPVR